MLIIAIALNALLGSVVRQPHSCALPCSCNWERDPQRALHNAHAVFEGLALDSTRQYSRDSSAAFLELYHVRVVVGRVWKGAFSDTVTVYTGEMEAGCGFQFQRGHRYLLFLYRSETGRLLATYCSLSRPLERSESVLERLGKPLR